MSLVNINSKAPGHSGQPLFFKQDDIMILLLVHRELEQSEDEVIIHHVDLQYDKPK